MTVYYVIALKYSDGNGVNYVFFLKKPVFFAVRLFLSNPQNRAVTFH